MEQLDFLLIFTAHVTNKSQTASQSAQPACGTNTTALNESGSVALKTI